MPRKKHRHHPQQPLASATATAAPAAIPIVPPAVGDADAAATAQPLPVFMDTSQIAKLFRVQARTIRKWIKLGHLPSIKVHRTRILVSEGAVREFLKKRTQSAA